MPLTLLFDLDDTLLNTNLNTFVPAYFQALTQYFEPYVLPTVMLRALMIGTNLMNESADIIRSLKDVFDSVFYPALGIAKDQLIDRFDRFYDEVFPTLQQHTELKPEAISLIQWAFDQGFHIAIATDPLFPRKATFHRLRWAGLEPEQFEIVSTYDDFHFTKTHPAYYAEMLGRMGWNEGPVLMVGNDPNRDLIPAHQLGLKTYFIGDGSSSSPGIEAGKGSLGSLRPWLESVDLSSLQPSFNSRDAIYGIMQSTPAVLSSLTQSLADENWEYKTQPDDWAMNEIICHLRDTEIEIHKIQLDLMIGQSDAFIPRPDTSVWANERDYLQVDGIAALREFTAARMGNLQKLNSVEETMWPRKARHAIFGPTNFLEAEGFMADHDRMHIQQAFKTLQKLRNWRGVSAVSKMG